MLSIWKEPKEQPGKFQSAKPMVHQLSRSVFSPLNQVDTLLNHIHESEHLNYILEGDGVVMEGDTPRTIGKGDFVLVIPGEKHQYRNTGDVPLVFMCMVPGQYE